MRILITGGQGTIGKTLYKELESRGHHVMSCDLFHAEEQLSFSIAPDVKQPSYVRCDVGEYRQLQRLMDTCGPFDVVYHCAAEFGRWNGEDYYEALWKTNVTGTKHIIRLQEERGFRLVHFSSSEVYGDWPELMIETVMDNHVIKQLNDYAMTKWVNEMQILNSAKMHGTQSVIVRLFNTYGPGEYYSPYRSVNCRFLYCALKGLPFTVFGGHWRTSTYLSDAVRTCANVTANFIPGETYNIGGTELHTIEELAELVIEVTGADPNLIKYKESEPMTTTTKRVDVSKARRDLEHKNTINLRDGLQLTAEWMRKVYGLIG